MVRLVQPSTTTALSAKKQIFGHSAANWLQVDEQLKYIRTTPLTANNNFIPSHFAQSTSPPGSSSSMSSSWALPSSTTEHMLDGDQNFPATTTTALSQSFAFDHIFAANSTQLDVCSSMLVDSIATVMQGNDVCLLNVGDNRLGAHYTMTGSDFSPQHYGILPCAISWLFKAVMHEKSRTNARFSIHMSAVGIGASSSSSRHEKDDSDRFVVHDVLKPYVERADASDSLDLHLFDDPAYASSTSPLLNITDVKVSCVERAAFCIDAIQEWRRVQMQQCKKAEHNVFVTLQLFQCTASEKYVTRSRLHLFDIAPNVDGLSFSSLHTLLAGREQQHWPLHQNRNDIGANSKQKFSFQNQQQTSASCQLLSDALCGGECTASTDRQSRNNLSTAACKLRLLVHASCDWRDSNTSLETFELFSRLYRLKTRRCRNQTLNNTENTGESNSSVLLQQLQLSPPHSSTSSTGDESFKPILRHRTPTSSNSCNTNERSARLMQHRRSKDDLELLCFNHLSVARYSPLTPPRIQNNSPSVNDASVVFDEVDGAASQIIPAPLKPLQLLSAMPHISDPTIAGGYFLPSVASLSHHCSPVPYRRCPPVNTKPNATPSFMTFGVVQHQQRLEDDIKFQPVASLMPLRTCSRQSNHSSSSSSFRMSAASSSAGAADVASFRLNQLSAVDEGFVAKQQSRIAKSSLNGSVTNGEVAVGLASMEPHRSLSRKTQLSNGSSGYDSSDYGVSLKVECRETNSSNQIPLSHSVINQRKNDLRSSEQLLLASLGLQEQADAYTYSAPLSSYHFSSFKGPLQVSGQNRTANSLIKW